MVQFPTGKPVKIDKLSGTPRRVLEDLSRNQESSHRVKSPQVMMRKPRLYLAYGSNLNKRGMCDRASDAEPKGRVLLTESRLVFRGVADVECVPGDYAVPCGLWSISARDERNLDSYEGVGSGLYEKHVIPINKTQSALIYTMLSDGVFPPAQSYYDTIRQGYRDFGLDEEFLEMALRHSFKEKNPSEYEVARRLRQRAGDKCRELVAMPERVMLWRLARREEIMRRGSILEDETPVERYRLAHQRENS